MPRGRLDQTRNSVTRCVRDLILQFDCILLIEYTSGGRRCCFVLFHEDSRIAITYPFDTHGLFNRCTFHSPLIVISSLGLRLK